MSTTELATPVPALPESCQGRITGLVRRCGQGDESALGDLFDLTFFLVSALVKRGSRSPSGVDDEVVEAFRRIWHRAADYAPTDQGVLAWVVDQVLDHPASLGDLDLVTSRAS
jgi:hypothetical protein